jgi:predicted ATPase
MSDHIDSFVRGSPFLVRLGINEKFRRPGVFPFTLPLFAPGFQLEFTTPVTFLVGENGSGKSTILEGMAWAIGFGPKGGNRDHGFRDMDEGDPLGAAFRLEWRQRSADGFFLRAETFFDFTDYLESMDSNFLSYGGESFHNKSHGEAFLALFENRFEDGVYLLDEPEAALSPQRQLAFLRILHQLTVDRRAQFIIATHSPMLLAFPGATVLSVHDGQIDQVDYRETEHYRVMVEFLNAPERYFRYLFAPDE